jgi:hypothetical protein
MQLNTFIGCGIYEKCVALKKLNLHGINPPSHTWNSSKATWIVDCNPRPELAFLWKEIKIAEYY